MSPDIAPLNLTPRGIGERHWGPRRSADTLVAAVGNTSLLRLRSLEPRAGVELYAKAEWENPGGSIKDRAALAMMRDGERSGLLLPGKRIIDASSGNTGIAYAILGAALGYSVTVVVPENATRSRLELLEAYGADVVLTDPQEGMDGAISEVSRVVAENPETFFYPDQYNNPANWLAHYRGTGGEILGQTGGRVTHFVAGLGTTGTFVGTGRRLREFDPNVQLVAMQPDSPLHALEGIKHLESTAHVPGIFDAALADRTEVVRSEEAQTMAWRLGGEEGLWVGPSAAAAAVAAVRAAETLASGVVVTVFPDNAQKYLEEPFWAE